MKRVLATLLLLSGCVNFDDLLAQCKDAGNCSDLVNMGTPAQLSATPPSFDFMGISTEQNTPPVRSTALAFTNTGQQSTGTLQVDIAPAGVFTVDLTTTTCRNLSLTGGGTCNVFVQAQTTVLGPHAATLTVTDGTTQAQVSLSAVGAPPAVITVMPSGLVFPITAIGATSPAQTVTLTNVGGAAALTLLSSVSPADAGFALISNGCSTGLAADAGCTVQVAFSPGQVGTVNGTLIVGLPTAPQPVTLSGEGQPKADVAWMPTSLDIGDVDAGTTKVGVVTLMNNGGTPTGNIVVTMSDGGALFSVVNDMCSGPPLPGMGQCTVQVGFSPTTFQTGAVRLTANAGIAGTASVDVQGRGIDKFPVHIGIQGPFDGGTVNGAGYACPGTCDGVALRFGQLSLTASPYAARRFDRWAGSCAAAGTMPTCDLTVSGPIDAQAIFDYQRNPVTVTLDAGMTAGKITSFPPGIDCPGTCSADFAFNTLVTLTRTGVPGFGFQGWTGCSSSTPFTCQVITDMARNVSGAYAPYNKAFLTSTNWTVGGGLDAGDAFCRAHAADAGLSGNFVAYLAPTFANPDSRLIGSRGWVRVDGRQVFDDRARASSAGDLKYPLNLDERGRTDGGSQPVHIGEASFNCGGWTSTTGGSQAGMSAKGYPWWQFTTFSPRPPCATPRRLYCFEVGSYAPLDPLPIPDGGRIAFISEDQIRGTQNGMFDGNCASEASSMGWPAGAGWVALRAGMATSGADGPAAGKVNLNGPTWYRTDGVQLFANASDLGQLRPVLLATMSRYSDGGIADQSDPPSTGALSPVDAGTLTTSCNNWVDQNMSSNNARVGSTGETSIEWFSNGQTTCDSRLRAICIQK